MTSQESEHEFVRTRGDYHGAARRQIGNGYDTGFGEVLWNLRLLILFAEGLDVGFAVGIEEVFAALLPGGFEFRRGDVPVRAAFFCDGAKILAEIFHGGAAEEPVAIVDFVDDETGLENDDVGDHGIVKRIGVLGDVEILLDGAAGVGEKRPVGVDAGAIFIRLGDIVGAYGHETAIGDFEFAMELDEEFGLAAVLGAETSAAEDEDHGVRALQFGEFAAFRSVIGKLVVWESGAGDDVGTHVNTSGSWMLGAGLSLRYLLRERVENDAEQKIQG
jgi:hypothetical protein